MSDTHDARSLGNKLHALCGSSRSSGSLPIVGGVEWATGSGRGERGFNLMVVLEAGLYIPAFVNQSIILLIIFLQYVMNKPPYSTNPPLMLEYVRATIVYTSE